MRLLIAGLAIMLAATIALPPAAFAQAPALTTAPPTAAEQSVMQKIDLLFVQNSTGAVAVSTGTSHTPSPSSGLHQSEHFSGNFV